MYCRECGNQLNEKAEICTNCGVRPLNGHNYCQACGVETRKEQEFCIQCGAKLIKSAPSGSSNDNPSMLANIAACCFPIVGIILYFVWRDEKPRSAKLVCTWAIVGFAIGMIFYILSFALGFLVEASI